jgi:hypothetical protein
LAAFGQVIMVKLPRMRQACCALALALRGATQIPFDSLPVPPENDDGSSLYEVAHFDQLQGELMRLGCIVSTMIALLLLSLSAPASEITVASQGNDNLVNFGAAAGNLTTILSSSWSARQQITWASNGLLYGATSTTIQTFNPADSNVSSIIDSSGSGNPLSGVASFCFGLDGMLCLASTNNNNLIRYNLTGQLLAVVASNWEGKSHMTWGADGFLYGATANSIAKFDPASGNSFTLIDSSGANNPLDGVGAMAFGPDGALWVASANNGNLIRYGTTSANDVISLVSGTWSARNQLLWAPDGYLYGSTGAAIVKYDRNSANFFTLIDDSSGPISGVGSFAYVPEPTNILLAAAAGVIQLRRRRM